MAGDPGKLCHLLDIERPVLCAPMAGIAGGRLAAAVTAGGGLGFVGGGYGNPDWLDREMAQTDGARVGIGLITWRIDAATVANALQHRPAALWLSFDDPRPYAEAVHEAGVALICQVGSLDEARQAIEAEAEVIVAQGSESGGHGQSNRALFGLLPAVVEEADPIPVVAAGGISDRHGYEAAVALGGAGVALGTRLYATDEALDVDAAKQRLVDASGDDTVRGVIYDIARGPEWPEPYTGRSLRSELTERWLGDEDGMRAQVDEVREQHRRAAAADDLSIRVVWAGEGVGAVRAVRPAAEVVADFPAFRRPDRSGRS